MLMNIPNKIIVLITVLIVWLLSGFYTFELMKGEKIINSIQGWDFYQNPVEDFKFVIIHIFLSVIIGTILGLTLRFLLKGNNETGIKNKNT